MSGPLDAAALHLDADLGPAGRTSQGGPVVVVHGGAGPMRALGARETAYREGLAAAAAAGCRVLEEGGDALAAVVAATKAMEAHGAFNAGRGACLDEEGRATLDAALMRGRDRAAGAVGCATATVHPIDVCRALLEEGRHVLLVAEGADRRARRLGLPPLDPPDPERLARWAALRAGAGRTPQDLASVGRPSDAAAGPAREAAGLAGGGGHDPGHDTVGAVALDAQGRLAAACSTGGLWLKAAGRVGDSPVPGAGLFACDDLGGAASATGIGERILRGLTCKLAVDACLRGAPEAARAALEDLHRRFGPESGGLIVVDRLGRVGAAFDTPGMGRAIARPGLAPRVAVWPEESA